MVTETGQGRPAARGNNIADRLAANSRRKLAFHRGVLARRLPKIFATEIEPGEVRTAVFGLILTCCMAGMALSDVNLPAYRILFHAFSRHFLALFGIWLFASHFFSMLYERRSPRRIFQAFTMIFLLAFGLYTLAGSWHVYRTIAAPGAWFSLACAADAAFTLRILWRLKPESQKARPDYGYRR